MAEDVALAFQAKMAYLEYIALARSCALCELTAVALCRRSLEDNKDLLRHVVELTEIYGEELCRTELDATHANELEVQLKTVLRCLETVLSDGPLN
jgi:hypothetical protein